MGSWTKQNYVYACYIGCTAILVHTAERQSVVHYLYLSITLSHIIQDCYYSIKTIVLLAMCQRNTIKGYAKGRQAPKPQQNTRNIFG